METTASRALGSRASTTMSTRLAIGIATIGIVSETAGVWHQQDWQHEESVASSAHPESKAQCKNPKTKATTKRRGVRRLRENCIDAETE